jgi:hypothetical protein
VSVSLSRRLGAGAALIVAAVALSGCGPVEAGSAAIVGDRRISTRELEQATADINAFTGPDTPVSQQAILFDLIISPYFTDRVAKVKAGALASQDEARTQLKTKVPDPSEAAVDVLRVNLSIQRAQNLSQESAQYVFNGVTEDLKKVAIDVNPRYGRFDKTQMSVVTVNRNWLQSPPPSPSPTATGGSGADGGATQPTP